MKWGLRQKPLSHLNCFIKKKKKEKKKISFGFDELLVKHRDRMRLACCRFPQHLPRRQPSPTLPLSSPPGAPQPRGIPAAGRGAGSPGDGVSGGATCQTPRAGGSSGGTLGLTRTQAALAFSM